MPIRCVGRRYPDAPWYTVAGCLERPPPSRFQLKGSSFTGFWASINDVWVDVDEDSGGVIAQGPWDPTITWRRTLIPGRVIEIRKQFVAGQWELNAKYRHGFPGGAVAVKTYQKAIATGFPKWEATEVLRVQSTTPDWTFGGAISVSLRPATYELLPADFCILP